MLGAPSTRFPRGAFDAGHLIGAGNMVGGIATRALAGHHSVRLVDRTPATEEALAAELRERVSAADVQAGEGIEGADVVVLAVPYPAGQDVVQGHGPTSAGKTVVDISNPVDFTTFDSLTVAPGTSAAEQIAAAAAPGAHVVKAFNTTFVMALAAGEVGGLPLDVFPRESTDGGAPHVRDVEPVHVRLLRRPRGGRAGQ